jgi:hypothetical protein
VSSKRFRPWLGDALPIIFPVGYCYGFHWLSVALSSAGFLGHGIFERMLDLICRTSLTEVWAFCGDSFVTLFLATIIYLDCCVHWLINDCRYLMASWLDGGDSFERLNNLNQFYSTFMFHLRKSLMTLFCTPAHSRHMNSTVFGFLTVLLRTSDWCFDVLSRWAGKSTDWDWPCRCPWAAFVSSKYKRDENWKSIDRPEFRGYGQDTLLQFVGTSGYL